MEWKNILKAPMPLDTRSNRDEDYKQTIIDYEKNVIEPALTTYFSTNAALENRIFGIKIYGDETELRNQSGEQFFYIGSEDVQKLGNNNKYILNVIGELYTQEGYTVQNNGDDKLRILQG
tara:strand:+ start:20425 stop:20784 length:360 start_codon:yes stop_codon:yes gene_type:complete